MKLSKRNIIITIGYVIILAFGITIGTFADSSSIVSKGKIVFNNGTTDTTDDVIFDASDLTTIENEIKDSKVGIKNAINLKVPNLITSDVPTTTELVNAIGSVYDAGASSSTNPDSLIPHGSVWASQGSTTTMANIGSYYRSTSGQATGTYDITFMFNGATVINLSGTHERVYQPSSLNGGQADFYGINGSLIQTKNYNLSRANSGAYTETIAIPSGAVKVRIHGMIGDSTTASDGCQGKVSATIY